MRVVERGLRDAHAARGHVDTADFERAHDVLEAPAFAAAEHLRGRYAAVVEGQLGGFNALIAELFETPARRETRRARVDEEGGDALVPGVGGDVGLGHREVDAGAVAVRHPHLLAVDDVIVAVAFRCGLDCLGIGTGVRFRDGQGAPDFRLDQLRQVLLLLRLGAVLANRIADEDVRVDDAGEAHPAACQLHADTRIAFEREVETAIRLRDLDPEEAHVRHTLEKGFRELIGVFEFARDGLDFAVHPDANVVDDLLGEGVGDIGGVISCHEASCVFGGVCRPVSRSYAIETKAHAYARKNPRRLTLALAPGDENA
jgi:hypothetical protein